MGFPFVTLNNFERSKTHMHYAVTYNQKLICYGMGGCLQQARYMGVGAEWMVGNGESSEALSEQTYLRAQFVQIYWRDADQET